MKGNKEKRIGIVLLIAAVLIAGYAVYKQVAKEKQEQLQVKTEEEEQVTGVDAEKSSEPEELEFEIRNLSESSLELLDMDLKALSEMIQEWTQNNMEYATAVGVEFYSDAEIDMVEDKYSFLMKTIVDVENGSYAEESRILVLDYYKEKNKYIIHP